MESRVMPVPVPYPACHAMQIHFNSRRRQRHQRRRHQRRQHHVSMPACSELLPLLNSQRPLRFSAVVLRSYPFLPASAKYIVSESKCIRVRACMRTKLPDWKAHSKSKIKRKVDKENRSRWFALKREISEGSLCRVVNG